MSAPSHLSAQISAQIRSIARLHGRPVVSGRVVSASGLTLTAAIPGARIGDLARVENAGGSLRAEVVGLRGRTAILMPLGELSGVSPGSRVVAEPAGADIGVGPALLGRVIDAFGRPLDHRPDPAVTRRAPIRAPAPGPLDRAEMCEPLETGVRVIDALLTLGRGQRVGVFAGAGVGKTTLLRQIVRQAKCDIAVIALVGERGGEVQDMLADGVPDGSITVVATSDRPPLERVRGALAATAIAEHFRSTGANVLLVVDSLTRYAMALREIGLSTGELPATKGYPPSVFAELPRLLERVAPMKGAGSITGIYTVLVEGDDLSDPVADSARSLLDGHIVLSREIAAEGHFPAVDVLASASRVMHRVVDRDGLALARRTRSLVHKRREALELRALGAYAPGRDPALDSAMVLGEAVARWSRQDHDTACARAVAMTTLAEAIEPAAASSAKGGARVA